MQHSRSFHVLRTLLGAHFGSLLGVHLVYTNESGLSGAPARRGQGSVQNFTCVLKLTRRKRPIQSSCTLTSHCTVAYKSDKGKHNYAACLHQECFSISPAKADTRMQRISTRNVFPLYHYTSSHVFTQRSINKSCVHSFAAVPRCTSRVVLVYHAGLPERRSCCLTQVSVSFATSRL